MEVSSKEKVQCSVCDVTMRKDMLERHWNRKHEDKLKAGDKPGWRYVAVPGQGSLFKHGFSSNKPSEEEEPVDAIDVMEEPPQSSASKRSIDDVPLDENSNKRIKHNTAEEGVELKVDSVAKDVKEVKAMLEKMEKKLFVEKERVEFMSSEESINVDSVIDGCRDIDNFDRNISLMDIVKEESDEENIDVYFCRICFDGTKPPSNSNKPGVRLYDRSKDDTTSKNLSRELRNLKTMVKVHSKSKTHLQKREILKTQTLKLKERSSRINRVGLNIFRTRYNGIMQAKSLGDFEEDILKGKMNGEDLGDINHSRKFAKELDTAIYDTMKDDIKYNVNQILAATNQKRPFGLVFDKMTPNKTTGQIHGIILPVPENPLTQDFLLPLMLDIPTVKDHSAEGLARSAKEIFNSYGLTDDMLEGIGVDGEYIKKGVKTKLLELLEIDGWTEPDKDKWISAVWEPAHQLELTTKDVRKLDAFDWLEKQINIINDVTHLLNIGKGLEQSKVAAEEVKEKFYKLRALSDTRFAAYFESSIGNFVKRTETTITALRKREQSVDKKVKDTAIRLIKEVCSKKFLILNLGLLDVYRLLGSVSSQLQTVQLFPWDIQKKQHSLLETLKKMENLKLTMNTDTGEVEEINQSLWPSLGETLDSILDVNYLSGRTVTEMEPRKTRSQADISSSKSLLLTVQNRLSSLCKHLASILESRLKEHPTPEVISIMAGCLDLGCILDEEETEEVKANRKKCLKKLVKAARIETVDNVLKQYDVFKDRFKEVVKSNDENDVVKRFESLLFQVHSCSSDCARKCSQKDQPLNPRVPNLFKILHLFFKEPSLYEGLEDFLSFLLRCIVKTHAEGCAESMGNIVEMHSDKRRGNMELLDAGKEAAIHWNCPPLSKADGLGTRALNKHFGAGRWNFITHFDRSDSTVTKRLRGVESKIAFF